MDDYKITCPREIVRELHDHEFLLSFNSDQVAFEFEEWWGSDGHVAFRKWLEPRNE